MSAKKITAAAAAVLTVAALAGCMGQEVKQDAPEPTPDNIVNGAETQVLRMPDGFRNVAVTKYVGKDGSCYMVFVTSRGIWEAGNENFTTLPSGVAAIPCTPATRPALAK
ncbi:hypothetical protein ACFOOK_26465 [Micromonospora krabiensis]|uniref:Lipoprotein n=1 Tax=Micromonospora krabiensis TaxID=307121 RepID=A0A1C3N5N7_9ACTN|nr:hypothetical protein [Micromonospora krabiensis]SBV27888.1 hypothetical protein GA0070620_3419 [Micromonospora krabiensis]